MYIYAYERACACVAACVYARNYMAVYQYAHIYGYVYARTYACVATCAYMRIYMCVYKYA